MKTNSWPIGTWKDGQNTNYLENTNKNTKRFSEKGLFLRYSLDPTQAVLLLRDYKN